MMRLMYSLVNSSEVSLPEAISAWSWATVASLCRVGTSGELLFRGASFAAATGSASKAARRRVRRAATIILFLLGNLGWITPGILLLWLWNVKRLPGFRCNKDVKRCGTGGPASRGCPVQTLLGRACSALGVAGVESVRYQPIPG